jgi:hypothetical protein
VLSDTSEDLRQVALVFMPRSGRTSHADRVPEVELYTSGEGLAMPEPSTIVRVSVGVLGLVIARRRLAV